jgi:hypothetical protein
VRARVITGIQHSFSELVGAATQRAAFEDNRAAAYGQRLDAMERSAAAAAAALQDAVSTRVAAAERSIDALRQEQQQVCAALTPAASRPSRALLQHQQLVQQLLRRSDSDLAAIVSSLRADVSSASSAAAAAAKSIDTLSEATRSRVAAVEAACGSICKETLMQVT